ncbi:MAG: 4-alpha-glucanotransferase [Acidobacteria bacterium]|nr:4-alpha-glucanotransferase [Acidobacteriota bacterium]
MRKSGILLHPTSLPGDWGIGELGRWAYRFADFLVESGQQLWQILPLGPAGSGYSPYQAYSSVAFNPMLISLETLAERGWLRPAELGSSPGFAESPVDFARVVPFKRDLLHKAASRFFQNDSDALRTEFDGFCGGQKAWLDPFARFAALKERNKNAAWTQWRVKDANPASVLEQKFIQFEAFREWGLLKRYCNDRGVEIIGDLPIFVAHDSADVWADPDLFDLDAEGRPRFIAGVPPDYFSETGQCWGNPLYRWDVMERSGYRWWIERIQVMLQQVDRIRLDHFRGFEKYWEIPAGSGTAAGGRWVDGPGDRFFEALSQALGELPFIAEDLGYITPEVHALRDRWGFPGMRVLHFAFGDEAADNPHKPFNFIRNCVAYTGTHDNNTTAGWFAGGDRPYAGDEIARAKRYLGADAGDAVWGLIRVLLASVADRAILPMQDVLGLGPGARMNTPATVEGNWRWRMRPSHLDSDIASRLYELNRIYGRLPSK